MRNPSSWGSSTDCCASVVKGQCFVGPLGRQPRRLAKDFFVPSLNFGSNAGSWLRNIFKSLDSSFCVNLVTYVSLEEQEKNITCLFQIVPKTVTLITQYSNKLYKSNTQSNCGVSVAEAYSGIRHLDDLTPRNFAR